MTTIASSTSQRLEKKVSIISETGKSPLSSGSCVQDLPCLDWLATEVVRRAKAKRLAENQCRSEQCTCALLGPSVGGSRPRAPRDSRGCTGARAFHTGENLCDACFQGHVFQLQRLRGNRATSTSAQVSCSTTVSSAKVTRKQQVSSVSTVARFPCATTLTN